MSMKKVLLGTIFLHLSTFFWGTAFIPQKILVSAGIPPFYTIALRFSFICLGFFFIQRKNISRKTFLHSLLLGMLLFIGLATQTYGLKKIDASVSAFLVSTSIILIPIFNFFLFKKRITKFNIFAIITALIGIIIFNITTTNTISWNFSIVLTLCGSLAFTFHIVLTNYFLEKGESPTNLHFFQCVFISLFGVIFGAYFESFPKIWTLTTFFAILYLGIFASIIGYGLQTYGQKLTKDPLKAGLIISLEPAWALVFAVPILGEILSMNKLLGISFIGLGIILCEWEAIYSLKNKRKIK